MCKQLVVCFGFVLALVLVAAINTSTAQPSPEVLEMRFNQEAETRLRKIEGDIEFLVRAMERAGIIQKRQ